MAIYHHTTRMIGRSQGGSPVKALAYMSGATLQDERTGEVFCFDGKGVQEVQILLPKDAPQWAQDLQELIQTNKREALQQLSHLANRAERRGDAQVYREVEFSLPRELTFEQNKFLASEYTQDQFCSRGMLAIQSFHLEPAKDGKDNSHCHTFLLTRELVKDGLSNHKNRAWNDRELHESWREQWAQYETFHLKMHGHDITLDHRSYQDQGLDIEPQLKLGKPANEQLKRQMDKGQDSPFPELSEGEYKTFGSPKRPKTAQNRIVELKCIQLRNLYRIIRRPEVVFEIVTRHHATFMWGDVQKVLARYVDDATLFQRLDGRLKNSSELILLKPGEEGLEEKAIYTTRNMLKAEKSLVQTAETLANVKSHQIAEEAVINGIGRMQEKLQTAGHNLSDGQERAIQHLTEEGQLKCIVGYAGAGKTTALEACRDIWEEAGYRVYGLAPTGRAAQNLEGSGIQSQTLHKFLKSFEQGRCQYNPNSVLVLDEAGMVDMQRFEQFLGAVQTLGVKAVVVGDAGQLQPVEAGPAFRLITERIPTSKLEEVVRQEKEWQREATVSFGRQTPERAIQAYLTENRFRLVEEKLPERMQSQPSQIPDTRQTTKATLLWDWHVAYQNTPQKTVLMMAYRNQDVQDLNAGARELLKIAGHIGKEETIYQITRDVEDDFGRRTKVKEDRAFSVGDRILFTRNKNDLGVRNGSCGTVMALEKRSIEVKLDTGKSLTFSPDIFPYFDHGWAVTIHKSQGMTVDKSFVLASYGMNRNLTYVALTRHREDVQIYGSTLDFGREDKIPDILSKSGEKLGAGDYLNAESLETLMKDEDRFLGKLFTRLSDELQAMGAVSKKAFEAVVDHFLGRVPERDASLDIFINPEIQREESRAEEVLRTPKEAEKFLEEVSHPENILEDLTAALQTYREKVVQTLDDVRADFEHPAFQMEEAEVYKDAFTRGLEIYGEEQALEYWQFRRERILDIYEQKLDEVQERLASPLLEHWSHEVRDQMMGAAFENPDQILRRLEYLEASKEVERKLEMDEPRETAREIEERQHSHSLEDILHDLPYRIRDEIVQELGEDFDRFKEVSRALERDPGSFVFRQEWRELGKVLFNHEEAYEHIKSQDKETAREIQKAAEQERSRGYEMSL